MEGEEGEGEEREGEGSMLKTQRILKLCDYFLLGMGGGGASFSSKLLLPVLNLSDEEWLEV